MAEHQGNDGTVLNARRDGQTPSTSHVKPRIGPMPQLNRSGIRFGLQRPGQQRYAYRLQCLFALVGQLVSQRGVGTIGLF